MNNTIGQKRPINQATRNITPEIVMCAINWNRLLRCLRLRALCGFALFTAIKIKLNRSRGFGLMLSLWPCAYLHDRPYHVPCNYGLLYTMQLGISTLYSMKLSWLLVKSHIAHTFGGGEKKVLGSRGVNEKREIPLQAAGALVQIYSKLSWVCTFLLNLWRIGLTMHAKALCCRCADTECWNYPSCSR